MSSSDSYHSGELAAQEKAGTRGAAAELAAGKRDTLSFSSNHNAFLAAQSFAVVSSLDRDGRVWVTPLFTEEGDLEAISETEIGIDAGCIPKGDVLDSVESGTPLSLLGIDLSRRIRHRINGVAAVAKADADTRLRMNVMEYAPNCPKYINRRELVNDAGHLRALNEDARRQNRIALSASDQEFVRSMDTLWIGSFAAEGGADCNHRGGKPGFVRVTSETTIEWPEYRGNGMFFTSGNLERNDKAGVTFIDFESGSVMQITGRAVVDWHHDGFYEGASRVIKFRIERLVRTDHMTHRRWKRLDYSPYNPTIAGTESSSDGSAYPVVATLAKIVEETPRVKTFRFLVPRRLPFLPGQYASFEFRGIPGGAESEIRTWTLSETPNSLNGDNTLEITVKRIPGGLVSNWLHDCAEVGLEVLLNGIQGQMSAVRWDPGTNAPVVPEHLLLLSAGIGITPNLAIVRGVGAFELQEQTNITMIHVERHQEDLLFQTELRRRTQNYPNFGYTNVIGSDEGRLTKERLRALVADAELQHAYVCGPTLFMSEFTEHLVEIGVPATNIHTESFEF